MGLQDKLKLLANAIFVNANIVHEFEEGNQNNFVNFI
jgi:hypothetical protein